MKNKFLLLAIGIAFTTQIIIAQVPSFVPTNGLIAYYPFNGNANDESGNNHNGIVNGATLTADRFGNLNSSYNFTGTTNEITLNNSQTLINGSFSVSAWCTIETLSPSNYDAVIIGQYNGQVANERKWLFGYRSISTQRGISYYLCDNSGNASSNSSTLNWVAQASTWYHITWVFTSGNSIKTYVNGVLHSEVSTTLSNFNNTANNVLTKIGNGIDIDTPAKLPWSGKIDDVGIWNRALTLNEITNLFDSKLVCEKSYATVGYLKASYNPTYEPIVDKSSWHYIAVTKNGLDGNIYLDGKLVTNSTYYNQPFIWNSLLLGASQACVSCSPIPDYIGLIDEVRVSNVVRTANEIQNHFNSNVPLSEDNNTLGLFHFDNALGNVMTNSATSKNGILYGGVNYVQGKFGQGLSFDGIDDYARFSQTIPVDSMTIEYWFKSTDDSGTMAMLEYAYNTGIYIQTISGDCQYLSINDKEVIIKNDIKIYPNPANDKITIDYSTLGNVTGYQIKIFNVLGQQVFDATMNQQQYIVPLNTWGRQGVYFVKIYDGSNKLLDTKKIILQ